VVSVPSVQHPLTRNPHKFLLKYEPNYNDLGYDHIKWFILALRQKSVQHEDVVYRLFPYTFEGKSSTWYFSQQPQSIKSWNQFEIAFIEKFGDRKTLEVLVMELSNMKM
jgi:hypothetical protein